jgi:hypothetical protein
MVDNSNLKGLENFVLLVVGAINRPISILHLEKEVFLLWNFHPSIKSYLHFIKHYRGPFSVEIERIAKSPFYLENCWDYIPPKKGDDLSGGYLQLNKKGESEYRRLYDQVEQNPSLQNLLTGIQMVRDLYDNLSVEELLLLIYDTYPEYREKSNVYFKIFQKRESLAKKMKIKGVIDDERYQLLISGM